MRIRQPRTVKNTLPQIKATQMQILELLKEHKRIALTCFEADVTMCHRKYLAEALAGLDGFCGEVVHIQTNSRGLLPAHLPFANVLDDKFTL